MKKMKGRSVDRPTDRPVDRSANRSMMMATRYFDRNAESYESNRQSGLLGWMVAKEQRQIMGMLDVRKGERVLDCGCGPGTYGKLIKGKGGKYVGIDISRNMVKEARRNGMDARLCAIEDFQFSKKFDKVLISGSLEFCKEPAIAIKQSVMNLKKGGSIVMIAPRKNIFGLAYFACQLLRGVKIKLFSRKDITRMIREAGLWEGVEKDDLAWSKPNLLVFVISGRKRSSS